MHVQGLDNETETMGNRFGGFMPIFADHIPHNIMGDIQFQSSKQYKLLVCVCDQGAHYRKILTLESYLFGNHGNFS